MIEVVQLYKPREVLRKLGVYFKYGFGVPIGICPMCLFVGKPFAPNKQSPGQSVVTNYNIVSMGARENYQCRWCGCTDKERRVFLYLNQIELLGKRVLHIAPERALSRWLRARTIYTAGDKFTGDARYTDGRYGDAMALDVTNLTFPDQSFDVVVCNHVLEHVEDDTRAMREIYRVLASGGQAILQVPVSYEIRTIESPAETPEERIRLFGQVDHVRIYGYDYPDRLREAGFCVEDIQPLSSPVLGINPREHLYVANRV